ncbi:MAG TPA: hypothetical protein ENN03_00260 [bacterium]|nr:hypothetical protein [bacterium]
MRRRGLILFSVVYIAILAMDYRWLVFSTDPVIQARFRDLFIGTALFLLFTLLVRSSLMSKLTLPQKLRLSGLGIVMIWAGLTVLDSISPFPGEFFNEMDAGRIGFNFWNHCLWLVLFYGLLTMGCALLIAVKALVFVQQGKKTQGNFRFLMILLFISVFVGSIFGKIGHAQGFAFGEWEGHLIGVNTVSFLIILMAVINGFRCKWIHYLNKRQKAACFFSLFLIILLLQFAIRSRGLEAIGEYSAAGYVFLISVLYIISIYTAMSFIGLLFLLPSAGILDSRIEEIKSLQALITTLSSVFHFDELVEQACQLAIRVANAHVAWIEMKEGESYRVVGAHGIASGELKEFSKGAWQGVRDSVFEEEAVLINDMQKDRRTHRLKHWKRNPGSLLAAKIRVKDEFMGILYAMRYEPFGFIDDSKPTFQSLAHQLALAMENINLLKVTIEQEVYREELRLAHEAQMRLLPRTMPEVSGLNLKGYCITANEVGGDFYDMIPMGEDRLDIAIGDVSGKGASAAFYMAELKGVIQALAPHFSSPGQILGQVNQFVLNHFESDTFVTMVYGIYIPSRRKLQVARAGHPPMAFIRDGNVEWIETGGVGLGLTGTETFNEALKEKDVRCRKGDLLFFHTDGVMEARNEGDEEYGEERLSEILKQVSGEDAEYLIRKVRESVEVFIGNTPKHDDITIVAIQVE